MMKKGKFKFFKLLKNTFNGFMEDRGMKLSASLSYYTIFSLGPVLIVIISLVGIFYGKTAVRGQVYGQIKGLVGRDAAMQVQDIIQNLDRTQNSTLGAVIGFIILLLGATGVFTEIQDSINYIWSVKAKPKKGWLKLIINRLLSFSLIVSMGFILLVSLVVNAVLDALSDRLLKLFPDYTIRVIHILNNVIIFIVITGLFAIIFKILPDAIIRWKDAFIGAAFTALLFLGGKFLITIYLGQSDLGATYGAAASIMILFLWVYYSSIILYFGAEFTKTYALEAGGGIHPKETAVFIIKQEAREIPTT